MPNFAAIFAGADRNDPVRRGDWYCLQCGQFGAPKKATKGSFAIEVFLWLMLIVPGVIYSLWRLTSKYKGCRFCGATMIVPPDSPKAQDAWRAQRATTAE